MEKCATDNYFKQIKPRQFECIGYNVAVRLCANQKCQYDAYICGNAHCTCHETVHQFCSTFRIDTAIKNWKQKQEQTSQKVKYILDRGRQIFNQIIQMVTLERQKFLNQFRDLRLKTQKHSAKFLDILEGRTSESLKGSLVAKVVMQFSNKQDQGQSGYDWIKVEYLWNLQKKLMLDKVQAITKKLFQSANKGTMESTIVTTIDEQRMLLSFLPKRTKTIRKIYRASSQHFSIQKFANQCCGIKNTITLALTTAGKKIGGFTPLAWKRTGRQQVDNTQETFLFSLTNNEKYYNFSQENTVFHGFGGAGPVFGELSSPDFKISENANVTNCVFNLGKSYTSFKLAQLDSQTLCRRFSGATAGYHICLKQWQIFEVIFE